MLVYQLRAYIGGKAREISSSSERFPKEPNLDSQDSNDAVPKEGNRSEAMEVRNLFPLPHSAGQLSSCLNAARACAERKHESADGAARDAAARHESVATTAGICASTSTSPFPLRVVLF